MLSSTKVSPPKSKFPQEFKHLRHSVTFLVPFLSVSLCPILVTPILPLKMISGSNMEAGVGCATDRPISELSKLNCNFCLRMRKCKIFKTLIYARIFMGV